MKLSKATKEKLGIIVFSVITLLPSLVKLFPNNNLFFLSVLGLSVLTLQRIYNKEGLFVSIATSVFLLVIAILFGLLISYVILK
jgi:hypothetical protein